MLEKTIQDKIIRYLNSRSDIYCFKTIATNKRGVPDIICCYGGRFIAFEVKAPKGRLTNLQKMHLEKIDILGGVAVAVTSLEEVKNILLKLEKELQGE